MERSCGSLGPCGRLARAVSDEEDVASPGPAFEISNGCRFRFCTAMAPGEWHLPETDAGHADEAPPPGIALPPRLDEAGGKPQLRLEMQPVRADSVREAAPVPAPDDRRPPGARRPGRGRAVEFDHDAANIGSLTDAAELRGVVDQKAREAKQRLERAARSAAMSARRPDRAISMPCSAASGAFMATTSAADRRNRGVARLRLRAAPERRPAGPGQ